MAIDWDTKVLKSLTPVIENLKNIKINTEEINKVSDWLAYEEFPSFKGHKTKKNPEEVIRTTLLINTLNFAFTDFDQSVKYEIEREGKIFSDSEAMFTQINETIDAGMNLYEGDVLSSLDVNMLRNIFSGNIEMPMMNERVKILNEVGEKLSSNYQGDWINFVKNGPRKLYSNGEGLIERLIEEFPRFDDKTVIDSGQEVHFYKLAQLAFWGIHGELSGAGHFVVEDMEKMSAFADYIVPVALEVMNIISYSDNLESKIMNGIVIERDSREEVEIRAVSLYATALLTEEINKKRPSDKQIIIPQLDYRLWKQYHATHRPHHLTITTMY